MDAEEITLHGGPLNGKIIMIPSQKNIVTAEVFDLSPAKPIEENVIDGSQKLSVRKIQYSRVKKTSDFEYDGFIDTPPGDENG